MEESQENSKFRLSLFTILKYIDCATGDKTNERKRCLVEGEQVLKAKHIICCGVQKRDLNSLKIVALCLKTSDLKGNPHQLSCTLNVNEDFKVECTCKAGLSAQCKHCVALLLYLNNCDIEKLDDFSCTDVTQVWGKKKLEAHAIYDPVPVTEFCHIKEVTQSLARKSTTSEIKSFRLKLISGSPNSALALHKKGRNSKYSNKILGSLSNVQSTTNLHELILIHSQDSNELLNNVMSYDINMFFPTVQTKINLEGPGNFPYVSPFSSELDKAYYEANIVINYEQAVEITKKTGQQGNATNIDYWINLRKKRITGSTAYSLFTYDKKGDWDRKIENHFKSFEFKGNRFTEFGKKNEACAITKFNELTGKKIITVGLVINPLVPWLGYSPDGIIFANTIPEGLIEVKCIFEAQNDTLENVYNNGGINFLKKENNICLEKETQILWSNTVRDGSFKY